MTDTIATPVVATPVVATAPIAIKSPTVKKAGKAKPKSKASIKSPAKATKKAPKVVVVKGENGRTYPKGFKPIKATPWVGALNSSSNAKVNASPDHRGFRQTDALANEVKVVKAVAANAAVKITAAGGNQGRITFPSGLTLSKSNVIRAMATLGFSGDEVMTVLGKHGIELTQSNLNCQYGDGKRYTDPHGVMHHTKREPHAAVMKSLTKADVSYLTKCSK